MPLFSFRELFVSKSADYQIFRPDLVSTNEAESKNIREERMPGRSYAVRSHAYQGLPALVTTGVQT
jgi:hypothetical protein